MAGQDIVNYYAALDIEDDNVDETVIKKAYRKLVLKWHPDKHPEQRDEAEDRIREINNAYEILSNPTKRSTYDQQRRAVKRRHTGFGPPQQTAAPRQRIPKEFMIQPIGAPDKFIRYNGSRLFIQSRRDVPDVQFQAFFDDTQWSLWWLPEVNNMCRVRAQGSKARGERSGASAGMCGGLNLSFSIDPMNPTDSMVCLEDARKGEKMDKVNFIAVPSPVYEGAFRFEAAYRKGYYLLYLPPNHCRVAPFGEADDAGVADFALVDFNMMFKFIEMDEVLQPVVAAANGWVTLDALRQDSNMQAYFQNILQRSFWDNEDFMTYFAGHWETWEFCQERCAVRLRPPEERLAQQLMKAHNADDVSSIIAGSKVELGKLPLAAASKAFMVLAKATDTEGLAMSKAIDRLSAQKKLFASLSGILALATQRGTVALPLKDMLDFGDLIEQVGGANPGTDLLQTRRSAQQVVADIAFRQISSGSSKLEAIYLNRVLCLPEAKEQDKTLASLCQLSGMVSSLNLESALEAVRHAAAASCTEVADLFSASVLSMLDSTRPPADDQLQVLAALGEAGTAMEDVAGRLQALAPLASARPLALAVLAVGKKGFASETLAAATQELGQKTGLESLGPSCLLELAVASTKSASLTPAVGAVARVAAASGSSWPLSDLVRLLLAVAKAKQALSPGDKAELLRSAAVVVTPELGALPAADLIKVILAIAGDGRSELLEAAAEEAVERRISNFPAAQLMLVTQGVTSGLGASHKLAQRLVDFWVESLTEQEKADDDDEVNKQRRELEKRNKLSADHLVQLAKVTAASGSRPLVEAIGAKLLSCAQELTDAGRKAIESQLSSEDGLGQFSRRDRLKKQLANRSASRSCSPPRKSNSPPRKSSEEVVPEGKKALKEKERRRSRGRSEEEAKKAQKDKDRRRSPSRKKSRSRRRSRSRKKKSRSRSRKRSRSRRRSRSRDRSRSERKKNRSRSRNRSRSKRRR